MHLRKRTLVTEDVRQFYPSIHRSVVFDIWHRFFGFPPPVAQCLTALTTKDGYIPQGAKTSTLLANLVFWEDEPTLVREFAARGIRYSRFIDDITVSSDAVLGADELSWVIAKLNAMVSRKGLRLARRKQTIARSGDRMMTTKLVVNARTSLPQWERSAIRAEVASAVRMSAPERETTRYARAYQRTVGRVGYLKQHHPREATALARELALVQPPSADMNRRMGGVEARWRETCGVERGGSGRQPQGTLDVAR